MLLTRDAVIEALNEIITVPATRTIRGLSTEVLLSPDDGKTRPPAPPDNCPLRADNWNEPCWIRTSDPGQLSVLRAQVDVLR